MANVVTYVTDAEIVEFFKGVTEDPTWVITNLPTLIRGTPTTEGAAFNLIKQRMDYVWCDPATDTKTHIFNGQGQSTILVEAPITQMDEVVFINPDGTEVALVLTGTAKNVWWDPRTGKVTIDRNQPWITATDILSYNPQVVTVFPVGVQNIRVVGQFGITPPATAKLLEIMIMYKMLQIQQPGIYKKAGNITREKIGRYEYQLGVIGFDHNSRTLSLDAYIDLLYDQLPQINTSSYEAV